MNKFYTLILLVFSSVAMAQPTFNSSNFFSIGTNVTYGEISSTSLSPGNSGANQTWNFGGLTTSGTTYTSQYISPVGAPGSSSFPGSTIVSKVGTAPNFSYGYYAITPSSAQIRGLYISGATPLTINYSNPQTQINFPLTNGGSGTDTYSSLFTTSFSGITVNQYQNGVISYVADGFGTVTTPTGTFTNCLRVKFRQDNVDSTVYVGLGLDFVGYSSLTTYTYFANINGKMIDVFGMSFDTTDSQGTITTGESATYYISTSTGLSNLSAPEISKLELSPNPATVQTSLTLNGGKVGAANLVITDITGKVIKKEEVEIAADLKYSINIEDLRAGLYVVSISQQDKLWAGQFVKY
jgi:hypothetical protein